VTRLEELTPGGTIADGAGASVLVAVVGAAVVALLTLGGSALQ
jgi:hypothetical protein